MNWSGNSFNLQPWMLQGRVLGTVQDAHSSTCGCKRSSVVLILNVAIEYRDSTIGS